MSNVSKYGWSNAIFAEILLFGSNAVIPFKRSTSSSFSVGVCCYIGIPLNFGKVGLKYISKLFLTNNVPLILETNSNNIDMEIKEYFIDYDKFNYDK